MIDYISMWISYHLMEIAYGFTVVSAVLVGYGIVSLVKYFKEGKHD